MDKARAEQEALALLQRHSVQHPAVDVEALAAKSGVRVERRTLEDTVSGCLIRAPHGVLMAINSAHHPNRQRFTIAHELGHLFLHSDQPGLFVDGIMVDFRADIAGFDPREVEANTFAAMLLMPTRLIEADLRARSLDPFDEGGVLRMARRYGVSQQALTIRLVQSGLVSGLGPGGDAHD